MRKLLKKRGSTPRALGAIVCFLLFFAFTQRVGAAGDNGATSKVYTYNNEQIDGKAEEAIDLSGTPWAGLTVPRGTELIVKEAPDGGKFTTLKFPGGVIFVQRPDGTIYEKDNSGKGAVLCLQRIYLEIKDTIERCPIRTDFMPKPQEAHFWLTLSLVDDNNHNKQETLDILNKVSDQVTEEQLKENDKRLSTWKSRPSGIGEKPILSDKIYREAHQKAEQGDPDSQYALAIIASTGMRGDGEYLADPDYLEAEKWLLKAAGNGHLTAQFDLASGYESGEFGVVNLQKAEEWYLKAAKQGSVVAQFTLGRLYAKHSDARMTYEELAAQLDAALDRIAEFVVANSLTPITKDEIEEKYRSYKMHMGCALRQGSMYMLEDFRKKTPEEFNKITDILLSTPRPPVMSPCL